MRPELFRLPIPFAGKEIPIYGFGLMLVIGFLLAIRLVKILAKRRGLDPEQFVSAALLALVTGIIGARLSHVLENFHEFTHGPSVWADVKAMFDLTSGGLTYYGGFLLAFPTLVIYALRKKIPVRIGMDVVAPCILVGLGFGRVGCFLNGCCYGEACSLPWAVSYPYHSIPYLDDVSANRVEVPDSLREDLTVNHYGYIRTQVKTQSEVRADGLTAEASEQHSLSRHPAQLYSTITALLLAALLVAYFNMPHAPGRVFALMMMLEGVTRFILEMLRTEPAVIGRGSGKLSSLPAMSLSMVLGVLLLGLGAVLWIHFGRLAHLRGEVQGTGGAVVT